MRRIVVIISAMLLATWGFTGTSSAEPVASQQDFETQATTTFAVNEVQTNGSGGTEDSFIEIRNINAADLDLTGFRIAKCTGAGAAVPFITILNPDPLPSMGYYVVASTGYSGPMSVVTETGTLGIGQNDGIALMTPAPVDTIVDAVSFGSAATVPNGCLEGVSPAVPSPSSNANNYAGQRCELSLDTDRNVADFQQAPRTPGADNFYGCI